MDKYEYLWMSIRGNSLPGDVAFLKEDVYGEECYLPKYEYAEIMSMSASDLVKKIGLTKKQAEYVENAVVKTDIDREYETFLSSNIKVVTLKDEKYPKRLRYIENRPYAIFYKGMLPSDCCKSVALIGSRSCTEYGRYMAKTIASDLVKKGVNVISGMAYGIDGMAQMAAIESIGEGTGKTGNASSFGVLGCGVDVCYPRANRELYDLLIRSGGVISEYPPGKAARSENFPLRNRIISGISDVVVVIEAKLKSGTFITVDYALTQGKEIMVVPGRATDPLSVGSNALLFQGAAPAQSADDVIRMLDTISDSHFGRKKSNSEFKTKDLKKYIPKIREKILLEREENLVYSVLDFYSLSPEEISSAINLDIFQVMNILVSLELKGIIKETGKNLYVKCR